MTPNPDQLMALLRICIKGSIQGSNKIDQIRKQHSISGNRVVVVNFKDFKMTIPFKLENSVVTILDPEKIGKPDVVVVVNEICVIKHLRQGYIYLPHPTTRKMTAQPFTPYDAWAFRYIQAVSNDPTLFSEALLASQSIDELMVYLPMEDIVKAIGPCRHDHGR